MNAPHRRNDWLLVIALALIASGAWLLLGNVMQEMFGTMWWRAVGRLRALAWPIVLIALGLLVYFASQRGWTPGDARGRRVYRSRTDRMVGGVLGGLGVYLGIDSTWLRIGYVLFAFIAGIWPAVVLYVIAMAIVPEESSAGVAPAWPHTPPAPGVPPAEPHAGPRVWRESGGTETVQSPAPPAPPAPGWSPHAEEPPAGPSPSEPTPSATEEPKQS